MRFETPISLWLIVVFAALAVVVSLTAYLRLRRVTGRGYLGALFGLRAALVLLLALLLFSPYHDRRRPDATGYRVAVLADVSGSMRVRDVAGERSRFEALRGLLDGGEDAPLARLRQGLQTEVYLFSEHAQRLAGGEFSVLPGETALGTALGEVVDTPAELPLGAIVVVGDGNSNAGAPVFDEAKRLRQLGIPVSCIGIGRPGPPHDIAVVTPEAAFEGTKGKPITVAAQVRNTFPEARAVTVELRDGDVLVDRQAVRLDPGPSSREVAFTVTPVQAGRRIYRFQIVADAPDSMPETDTAHAAVDVREPDRFQVLFLGASLGWEYKFLKLAARTGGGQIDLAAALQAGPGIYRHYGEVFKDDEAMNRLPESFDVLSRFDAVVLDSRAAPLMSPGAAEAFRQYVAARGGGLLVFGPLEPLGEAFRSILPAARTSGETPPGVQYMTAENATVFPADRAAALSLPPGPFLPGDLRFFQLGELKPGARPALSILGREAPLLAVQPYGSGRTALLGDEDTWRWRLASEADADRHTAFWSHLLVWLGSTGKPRLRARFDGRRLATDQSSPLQVEVLDGNFAPATAVQVTARLSGPDGYRAERTLAAAAEAPGIYEDPFAPPRPGEYRVELKATFAGGETIERSAFFLAAAGGKEVQSPEYREDVLRDLARVTGGVFHAGDAVPRRFEPPVSERVPSRSERVRWSESWLFLFVLFGAGAGEWFLRRRIGLK